MKATNTVLVVEDNPVDARVIVEAISTASHDLRVVVVQDGSDAIDYILQQGKYFAREPSHLHAVILDMNLPRGSGLDVLANLKSSEQFRKTPVIIVSGSDEDRDVIAAHNLGADAYLFKPISFEAIKAAFQIDWQQEMHH